MTSHFSTLLIHQLISIDIGIKSIAIKVTEKNNLSNKIDKNRWELIVIDNNRKKIIIDFYRKLIFTDDWYQYYRFLSIIGLSIKYVW